MMIERRSLRWAGIFGLASVVLWLAQLPLRLAGGSTSVDDGAAFARIVLDQALYVVTLLFAINLRHLVVKTHPERESAGTLVVTSTIVWLVVMLVTDELEGGAMLLRGGSTAFATTAMLLGSAAYATFVTGVLPRWSAWLAVAGVVVSAACIPATYIAVVTYGYDAGGWLPSIAAGVSPFVWLLAVSVWMLRRSIPRRRARPSSTRSWIGGLRIRHPT